MTETRLHDFLFAPWAWMHQSPNTCSPWATPRSLDVLPPTPHMRPAWQHVTPLQPPSALGTEKRVALSEPPEWVNWSACGTVRAGGYRDTPPCVITNLAWVLNVPVSPYPARRKYSTFSSNLLFTAMFHYKVKIFTEKKKGLKIGTHN